MDGNLNKSIGKVLKLNKNADVVKFMENIKIQKNKSWYIITEKEILDGIELHLIKCNNEGVNANLFISQVKDFYIKNTTNEALKQKFANINVVGNDKFSVIKNIPNIEVDFTENGVVKKQKFVNKIMEDLIKLLK